jgi:hypothetical protein
MLVLTRIWADSCEWVTQRELYTTSENYEKHKNILPELPWCIVMIVLSFSDAESWLMRQGREIFSEMDRWRAQQNWALVTCTRSLRIMLSKDSKELISIT